MKNELKIGDKLYRYIYIKGIFEYEVFGVRKYTKNSHYEIRCNACTHGYKCEVLILPSDNNKFLYIEMLNEDEEDKQYFWHNDSPYFLTEEEAFMHHGYKSLASRAALIKKEKEKLENLEKEYQEIQIYIESMNKKLKEKLEIKQPTFEG